MTTFYQEIPEFVTGQLVSATRLNQMLSNLDAAYGLDQRQETMYITGWSFSHENDYYWYGWCVLYGDRLVVKFDAAGTFQITWDDTAKVAAYTVTVTGAGPHTINIPGGYTQYDTYRIKIYQNNTGRWPQYIYLNSPVAVVGSLPAFTDGITLTSTDLNTIINKTAQVWRYHNQPVVGALAKAFGTGENGGVGAGGGGRGNPPVNNSFYAWSEHRHSQFQFYITTGQPDGGRANTLRWYVTDNSGTAKEVWTYDFTAPINRQFKVRLADVQPALDLTVGSWYQWTFTHFDYPNGTNIICSSNVYWYGEERYESAANWDPLNRWEHGDVVEGDAALPPRQPRLADMSHNLTWLDTRSRWHNHVQREPIVTYGADLEIIGTTSLFMRRVHRWLAYGMFDESTTATLRWSVDDKNVMQAFDLPGIDEDNLNEAAYFDLDQSPIKVGQVFYVTKAKYAIQTPYTK